ncbi:hypothetical protein UA08_04143 [Talaromyces atroroseus]|uniref:DUF7703 domain-containing protein n=1 Tax=Talaromyces atroroseus TaxID=1441469 RepID=A0A1Q5Q8T4_TALAT|nr:hypothetical protein UA08_04143 [Talaromyces atroroseus]OKL60482.1 hypothetical protein UA08_04143 [Talaromyces atroroseus]
MASSANSAPSNGITGGYTGHNLGLQIAMGTFTGVAWYNATELIVLIFVTFRQYRGLYFWSLLVSSALGVLPYSVGFLMKFFQLTSATWLSVTLLTVGWNPKILRPVLCMIIVNAILLHIPTTVLTYGSNFASSNTHYVNGYNVMEKIQMTGFCLQEFILSGIYIYETLGLLRGNPERGSRKIMYQLLVINLIIILMDVGLLVVEYMNFYVVETTLKGAVYSIKLKLEFAVLGQLIRLVRTHGWNNNPQPTITSESSHSLAPNALPDFVDASRIASDVTHPTPRPSKSHQHPLDDDMDAISVAMFEHSPPLPYHEPRPEPTYHQPRRESTYHEIIWMSGYISAHNHQVNPSMGRHHFLAFSALAAAAAPSCPSTPTTLHLPDAPYHNFFYSDCNTAVQVVVTSPQSDSDLSVTAPRLIVAWPAGNSGVCTFFEPQNGVNGSLSIELVNSTIGSPLAATYSTDAASGNDSTPFYGVTGTIRFNSSAILTLPILGSIRTIRDYVEGSSILQPEIQDAIHVSRLSNGGASLQRLWLDNVTSTHLDFAPASTSNGSVTISGSSNNNNSKTLVFEAGDYVFTAEYNYMQLTQLSPGQVLSNQSAALIQQQSDTTEALSFLSYSTKLLAGAWRFLTYFGRDSMISALLLQPVLSRGKNGALEAVIAAVLERINRADGSVCHEETIGDYATWLNEQNGVFSTEPQCNYEMVDSDYFLPILMNKYFVEDPVGRDRVGAFLNTSAGGFISSNSDLTYQDMAVLNAERIMRLAAPFAGNQNQTESNLIHLKEGQIAGEWRDSAYGIGGGRIPYDVNTALVPAALRAIASLARNNFFPVQTQQQEQWDTLADKYAQVWEDETLRFFNVTIPVSKAKQLVASYAKTINFTGPNQTDTIDSDVNFHALALNGYNNQTQVLVMNTDDCFRHFLLNTTRDQNQLTFFMNQTANNIRRTFPAGLLTDAGMLVSNPAYGQNSEYAENWDSSAYHGTVIWSWPLAMMAKGLEQQLGRCRVGSRLTQQSIESRLERDSRNNSNDENIPDFCHDSVVYSNVKSAYNVLWDSIEANQARLSQEVWSWTYDESNDTFISTPLGVMPPPPGMASQVGMFSRFKC